ncbi:TPA: hypothetical protein N0F65_004566 [Lagenidium giganteum]|uniref:Kinesin-like protein n=1 Tax=Lagenidium giganteum TaxID=4803 RepID=A0AAV2ZC66_9STRA|nr:TPA: hypothetical protein N0F65_004566 [Lagenidium giganteum]
MASTEAMQMPMAMATPTDAARSREKRIKVCVRLRPFTKNEAVKAGGKAAWTWHDNTIYQQIFPAQAPARKPASEKSRPASHTSSSSANSDPSLALPSSYSFDRLYAPETKTTQVYESSVKDVIVSAMEGYNSSVFLYGQTGTGKTYTMQGNELEPGIIQLAVQDIFDHVDAHSEMEFLLRFSYLEIYNERIYDLLAAGAKNDIKVCEIERNEQEPEAEDSGCREVVIKGLREDIVLSADHVLSLVEVGNFHRHVAATESNNQSSRSHTIFRLVIESQRKPDANTDDTNTTMSAPVRSATLSLIDLAGSESVRLANNGGHHKEEGKYINRSLLTLGHIIWKLSRDKHNKASPSKQQPLPYRNSKLTRILQSSLGGKAQIAVVCTIAPSVECLTETHNTLKFATRARRVKHRATVNENNGESALLKKYRSRMRELELQLEDLQRRKSSASFGPGGATQASVNLSTIEERQMELQFAISNINRVILNSTNREPSMHHRPTDSRHLHHHRSGAENQFERSNHGPSKTASFVKEAKLDLSFASHKKAQLDAAGIRQRSPPPSFSSQHYVDAMEPEVESDVGNTSQQYISRRNHYRRHTHPHLQRPSLTTVLKTKYLDALWKLEEATRRRSADSSMTSITPSEREDIDTHKELLREFVRGLEIAESEQEWRLQRIRELESENHNLRQILDSREEELLSLKNIRVEDETF